MLLWARRRVFSSQGFYYLCENGVAFIKASFNGCICILWALWDLFPTADDKEPLYNEIKMRLKRWGIAEKTDFGILRLFTDFPHLHNQHRLSSSTSRISHFQTQRPHMIVQWKEVDGVAVKTLVLVYSVLWCLGHSKAVRDICFNNTGSQFLSAAYDRYLKLWDSETGESHHLILIRQTSISCGVQMCHWVFLSPQASASHTSATGRSRTVSNSTPTRTNRTSLWQECRIRRLFR